MQEEIKKVHQGKPWKNESFHDSFELADQKREKLLKIWKSSEQHKGMQIKVRWLPSREQFVVKTRLDPNLEVDMKEENKKRGKSRKRNKKNTDGRMFDATTIV